MVQWRREGFERLWAWVRARVGADVRRGGEGAGVRGCGRARVRALVGPGGRGRGRSWARAGVVVGVGGCGRGWTGPPRRRAAGPGGSLRPGPVTPGSADPSHRPEWVSNRDVTPLATVAVTRWARAGLGTEPPVTGQRGPGRASGRRLPHAARATVRVPARREASASRRAERRNALRRERSALRLAAQAAQAQGPSLRPGLAQWRRRRG